MDCPTCKELERSFESRRRSYIAARFAAYYRVSTELAAYKNVEMERAKSDLKEHQLVCVCAASGPRASWLNSTLGRHAESNLIIEGASLV
jgi:Zn-dependent peptidase ImmA (M78 family)